MTRKIPGPCRHQGCPALTTTGLCDVHRKEHEKDLRERVDVSPEKIALRDFYRTKAWRTFSIRYRATAGACRCGRSDTIVDHVNPITPSTPWPERFDPRNLQVLCRSCHARKRQVESRRAMGLKTEYPNDLLPRYFRPKR